MCVGGYVLQLVAIVVKTFGDAYPELVKAQEKIHSIIAEEEASFSRTLVKGIERFKKLAATAQVGRRAGNKCFIAQQ